jgi:hypothetical protein
MGALTTEGAGQVCSILDELEAIRAQLADARACRLKVGEVDGIKINGDGEIRTLWREGNRLAQDLGVALYFEPRRQPFGTSSASWAGGGSNRTRRG